MRRWKHNIKTDLKHILLQGVNYITWLILRKVLESCKQGNRSFDFFFLNFVESFSSSLRGVQLHGISNYWMSAINKTVCRAREICAGGLQGLSIWATVIYLAPLMRNKVVTTE